MIYLQQAFYLLVVLGLLIFIHELGHFLAAKAFGVRVEVFSLGFGRRLFGFRHGTTDYRVAVIPLGGYVRMAGEVFEDDGEPRPDHLAAKPRWQRVVVYLAGPAMNVALALALWFGLLVSGMPVVVTPEGPPVVGSVEEGSAADRAGLLPGDVIEAIDGEPISQLERYAEIVALSAGRSLVYRIRRGERELELRVTPDPHPIHGIGRDGVVPRFPVLVGAVAEGSPAQAAGFQPGDRLLTVNGKLVASTRSVTELIRQHARETIDVEIERNGRTIVLEVAPRVDPDGIARIGISLAPPTRTVSDPGDALGETLRLAREQAGLLYRIISGLVRFDISPKVLSGPLEIARVTQQVASYGIQPFLQLLAFISFQLGLFNLLPIPVLDGGQILILGLEMIGRRELPRAVKERLLQFGVLFMVMFAVMVLMLDVYKRVLVESKGSDPPAAAEPAP